MCSIRRIPLEPATLLTWFRLPPYLRLRPACTKAVPTWNPAGYGREPGPGHRGQQGDIVREWAIWCVCLLILKHGHCRNYERKYRFFFADDELVLRVRPMALPAWGAVPEAGQALRGTVKHCQNIAGGC
jgi:hypothetical protein